MLKNLQRFVLLFIFIKFLMGIQNILYPKPRPELLPVTKDMNSLFDSHSQTFQLIGRNASFLQEPSSSCRQQDKLILSVLTAPNNVNKRHDLRERFGNVDGVSLLFLLGKTTSSEVQERLNLENRKHGDLLQGSILDSYDTLAYKTLMGFIWINNKCPHVKFVAKMDDDVTLDLGRMLEVLDAKYGDNSEFRGNPPAVLECPSVMKNMRPWRHNHTNTIMGKWSVTYSEMSRRVFPDFCPGWLYVTTPRVGLDLAEVANMATDIVNVARLDDIYVTGFLRERLEGVKLQQLHSKGLSGLSWNAVFSHCPFLGITKNIFYNDIVLDKGSGAVTYIKGQKFYWCAFLEFFILENVEYVAPGLSPSFLWDICAR